VSVWPHAACNIKVKCTVRIWWAVSAVYDSNMKKNFICLHIQICTECRVQIAGIEKYTGVWTVDCNMISCKIFYDITLILLEGNNLGNWICIN
jgi:hypothetical protein